MRFLHCLEKKDYDLSDFTFDKLVTNTSPTLLKVVYHLVSHGDISKTSLNLSQSIQFNMTTSHNQTSLGLALKLHHKFGSKGEVNNMPGFTGKLGPVFSQADNFDLVIYSPNGRRSTHVMVSEFRQHLPSTGILEIGEKSGVMRLTIPRLTRA